MKVSKEQAARNRDRILDVAAKLFRERGFDGIGVADLMREAGLTHGGFYGHFGSKEDLMAEASARAMAASAERWSAVPSPADGNSLAALATKYLRTAHRDQPGGGCVMAALGADAARQGGPVRRAFTHGFRSLVDVLAERIPGRSAAARRRKAMAGWSALVGAMVLARAVDDPALSEEILNATAAAFG